MSTKLKIPPEFDAAPIDERLAYVGELWDRIAESAETLPIPEEHKRKLDERLEAHKADPKAGRPWEEVGDEILDKLRRG